MPLVRCASCGRPLAPGAPAGSVCGGSGCGGPPAALAVPPVPVLGPRGLSAQYAAEAAASATAASSSVALPPSQPVLGTRSSSALSAASASSARNRGHRLAAASAAAAATTAAMAGMDAGPAPSGGARKPALVRARSAEGAAVGMGAVPGPIPLGRQTTDPVSHRPATAQRRKLAGHGVQLLAAALDLALPQQGSGGATSSVPVAVPAPVPPPAPSAPAVAAVQVAHPIHLPEVHADHAAADLSHLGTSLQVSGAWKGVVELPPGAVVSDVRAALRAHSGLPFVRIIHRGKILVDDSASCAAIGMLGHSKIMIMKATGPEGSSSSAAATAAPVAAPTSAAAPAPATAGPMKQCLGAGCQFFGAPEREGYCSVCYKKYKAAAVPTATASAAAAAAPPVPPAPAVGAVAAAAAAAAAAPAPAVAPSSIPAPRPLPVAVSDASADTSSVDSGADPKKSKKKRCAFDGCHNRILPHMRACRCGNTYCDSHRMPESHQCNFDHAGMGRQLLAKLNPTVRGSRVEQI